MVGGRAPSGASCGTSWRCRSASDGTASGALKFTNGKDATKICIPQYEQALARLLGSTELLGYSFLGWGAAEAEQLAAALTYAQRTGVAVAAKRLMLVGNKLGSAGVKAIGEVIEAGALPRLEMLGIGKNGAENETRRWIEGVARAAGCSEVSA